MQHADSRFDAWQCQNHSPHPPTCAHAGEMVFEFTQIHATQPEKPYSFAVKVEGESFTGETQRQQQQQQRPCRRGAHLDV